MTLAANTVVFGLSGQPYFGVKSGVNQKPSIPVVQLPTGTVYGCAFSPDGSKLALAHNTSPYITVYNTADWSKFPNPATLPGTTAYACAFSPDGSKLAVAHSFSPYITIYNTSDWSKIADPATLPAGASNSCAFSPDGSKLVVGHNTSPYITVYNTADWSKVANPATLPGSTAFDCAFSPDGSKLAIGHLSIPYLTLYNTADWSKIANPSTLPASTGNGCAFSPDGSKLAVSHPFSPYITIYNTADWSTINTEAIVAKIGTLSGRDVIWRSNTLCSVATGVSPGIIDIDTTTGLIVDATDMPYGIISLASLAVTMWEINGIIDENLAATDWVAIAQDYETGDVLSSVEFTGTTFTLPIARPAPVSVTVFAKQGNIWKRDTQVNLGDKCYPTNPSATPYYYVCTTAGMTGVSEPVFPITAGGTVPDGTAEWTRVERLIQPVTQSPLIPTPV